MQSFFESPNYEKNCQKIVKVMQIVPKYQQNMQIIHTNIKNLPKIDQNIRKMMQIMITMPDA